MNALSRREEETLLKKTKAFALKACDPVVKGEAPVYTSGYERYVNSRACYPEFADCAEGRTFSVAWECRSKYKAVQECMLQ